MMNIKLRSKLIVFLPVLVLAIVGGLSIFSGEKLPLLSFDSLRYFSGTESILSTGTYRVFGEASTHYPPGLPLVVAIIGWVTGLGIESSVMLLNIISFSSILLILYVLITKISDSYRLATLSLGAIVTNSFFLSLFDKFWSEPLFITLLLIVVSKIIFLGEKKGFNFSVTTCLGLVAGAAILVRYAGGFLIGFVLLAILLFGHPTKKSILFMVQFLCVMGVIVFGTFAFLDVSLFSENPRGVAHSAISSHDIADLFVSLSSQLYPAIPVLRYQQSFFIVLFLLVPFIFLAWLEYCRFWNNNRQWAASGKLKDAEILIIALVGYMTLIILSKFIFDSAIPFDLRTFYPAYIILILFTVSVIKLIKSQCKSHDSAVVSYLVLVYCLMVEVSLFISLARALKFIFVEKLSLYFVGTHF